jgi:chromosome segregation ATPase
MATVDELEQRVRFVESSLKSERDISHAVLQQAVRNGAALGVLRTEVNGLRTEIAAVVMRSDELSAGVAVAQAELRDHGALLIVLQQDVRQLRTGQDELRRGQEELHVRMDRLETGAATRHAELSTRIDHLQAGAAASHAELDARIDHLQAEAAARHVELLAAIRGTPPA